MTASARGLAEMLASEELNSQLEELNALALEGVEGWKDVPGFEVTGLRVAGSRILEGYLEGRRHLVTDATSSDVQIRASQEFWERLFSHWAQWRLELEEVIQRVGQEKFIRDYLPKTMTTKSWRSQDQILSLLPADMQNQIFASVAMLTA
ncbi:hypothetical protein AK812_SmicGene16994 [Symbiodinium microadriaticum]|uniref:Uncharacterized protein n=1 Tax=Symbiodinium microadriaticum TaxID=2951 RepID=A0A1Q9DYS1_SYMMI|nr:hypothetical protein AK812_SmicGene16994 [Symbiodinium microadriaticum]